MKKKPGLIYARVSKGGRWPVCRNDGHTVCGIALMDCRPTDGRVPPHVCKSCERMTSGTANLARGR